MESDNQNLKLNLSQFKEGRISVTRDLSEELVRNLRAAFWAIQGCDPEIIWSAEVITNYNNNNKVRQNTQLAAIRLFIRQIIW